MSIRYRRGALKPMACLSEGYALIKDRYMLFVGISFVGMLIAGAVPLYILYGPMMCGIHYCLFRQERRQNVEFGMLFKGFDHFGPSLVATLFMVIPMLVVVVPAYVIFFVMMMQTAAKAGPGAPPPPNAFQEMLIAMGLFFLVVFVISVVVSALMMFVYPLIVDRRVGGVEAFKTSASAAISNIGGVLVLLFLQWLLLFVGFLLCYVGAFFVMPILFASTAIAYQQVFGEGSGQDDYDDHRDEGERDYVDE